MKLAVLLIKKEISVGVLRRRRRCRLLNVINPALYAWMVIGGITKIVG